MILFNAVKGRFENRPNIQHVARPYFSAQRASHRAQGLRSFYPEQLAQRYSFPAGDGAGRKIAIIELGGGYSPAGIRNYWGQRVPKIIDHGLNGASNQPGSEADGEVILDLCIVGRIAPAAEIHMVFAPNTSDDFVAAHTYCWQVLKADECTISWGGAERSGSIQYANAFQQSIIGGLSAGMNTHCAGGDNDQGDGMGGVNADLPGSIPECFTWGGTTILADGSEIVWNTQPGVEGTGGGFSAFFQRPPWQNGLSSNPMRLEPDFAMMADPANGWIVSDGNGGQTATGGTSACAPAGAAFFALLRNAGVTPTHANIYAAASTFRDITAGNND